MTELLLIRHAQTAWNVEGWVQGHTDVPLNDAGHRMACVLADWLMASRSTSFIQVICGAPGRPPKRWRLGMGSR